MRRLAMAVMMVGAAAPLAAADSCITLDPKAVAGLFDDWNFSLSSLDANQVAQRYWPNAVLLPTVSNTPRTSAAMINDYFVHFLAKRPRGRIDTRTVQSGCNLAMDMGTYTFSLMDDKGAISEVAARYTFVYQYRDGAWKIIHHHSSAMPETSSAAPATVAASHGDAHMLPPAAVAKPQAAPPPPPPRARIEKPAKSEKVEKAEHAPAPVVAAAAHAEPASKPAEAPRPSPATKAVEANKPAPTPTPASNPKPEVKTAMFANLASSPPPAKFYPAEAAKHKERGSVNLKVCADDTGAVSGDPEVLKSSGSKLLDEAALSWARAAKWVPATVNQRRVEGCTQVDVAFEAVA